MGVWNCWYPVHFFKLYLCFPGKINKVIVYFLHVFIQQTFESFLCPRDSAKPERVLSQQTWPCSCGVLLSGGGRAQTSSKRRAECHQGRHTHTVCSELGQAEKSAAEAASTLKSKQWLRTSKVVKKERKKEKGNPGRPSRSHKYTCALEHSGDCKQSLMFISCSHVTGRQRGKLQALAEIWPYRIALIHFLSLLTHFHTLGKL